MVIITIFFLFLALSFQWLHSRMARDSVPLHNCMSERTFPQKYFRHEADGSNLIQSNKGISEIIQAHSLGKVSVILSVLMEKENKTLEQLPGMYNFITTEQSVVSCFLKLLLKKLGFLF